MLRFDESIYSYKKALEIDREPAIRNELEDAETYKSNYDRYQNSMEKEDFENGLSCINYLCNKIPSS